MRVLAESLKNPATRALLGILLLGAFLRFFELSRYPPALHSDEAVNGINTLQVIRLHQIRVFYPENNGREGLFINAQAVAVWLFGTKAWALRSVSGIFGVLTILGLFFLVRELFLTVTTSGRAQHRLILDPTRLALLAAFFLSTSFWPVLISRLGFRANSAPFCGVWAFYLLLVSWRKIAEKSERTSSLRFSWALGFFAGLVFGLGFHSYIAYRVMPLLVGALFASQLLEMRKKKRPCFFLRYAAAVVAGTLVAITPLVVYFVHHPHDVFGRAGQLSVFGSKTPVLDLAGNLVKTMGMFNVVGDTNPRHNLTGRPWLARFVGVVGANPRQQQLVFNLGRPQLFWPVGIFFLIGLYAGLRRVIREAFQCFRKSADRALRLQNDPTPANPSFFLLSWLVVAAVPVVISNEDLPHALRSVLMIPPVFTFAAMGAVLTYDFAARKITGEATSVRRPILLQVVAYLVCALLAVQTYVTYFFIWGPRPLTAERFNQPINDKADALGALPPNLPKYVIVPQGSPGIEILQFLTDTYTAETQEQRHIRYVDPRDIDLKSLPPGAYVIALP